MGNETRIRVLLALAGLEQRDVAAAAGISASTLCRALKGERRLAPETRRRVIGSIVEGVIGEGGAA